MRPFEFDKCVLIAAELQYFISLRNWNKYSNCDKKSQANIKKIMQDFFCYKAYVSKECWELQILYRDILNTLWKVRILVLSAVIII